MENRGHTFASKIEIHESVRKGITSVEEKESNLKKKR